jgi:AcrR family transcriptional regulator
MPRNAEASRQRIMAAATAEFAAHGIAGARMDRVAAEAASSKERIYAYYGNKDALFDAVFTESVRKTLEAVTFDAYDLPGYAGRMFDHFADHPDAQRLTTWYRLERPEGSALAAVVEANRTRLEALAAAPPTIFTPVELLTLIQAIASSWGTMNPEFAGAAAAVTRPARRRAVVEAVTRLILPG